MTEQISRGEEWLAVVRQLAQLLTADSRDAQAADRDSPLPALPRCGSVVLCSPHPDDESLTGALALRLARESGAGVVNLAMTLGRDPARQAGRMLELAEACRLLGFGNLRLDPPLASGSDNLGASDPVWQTLVAGLVARLTELAPRLVFFPHGNDAHPTHLLVHRLVREAALLYVRQTAGNLLLVETEYWHPMRYPNLLVGLSSEDVATLVGAVARHGGEVARTPYHRLLPVRLADNVRRGGELLNGFGAGPPAFVFGDLYRLSLALPGRVLPLQRGIVWSPREAISVDALLALFGETGKAMVR